MATFLVFIVIIYQIISLIRYVEKTNQYLIKFFRSVEQADFTQSFPLKDLGTTFAELGESFAKVTERFLKLRSEKEENFRYLHTVVQHISTAVISFKSDGKVELINNSAKKLLNISQLQNIKALEKFSKPLMDILLKLRSGETELLKIEHQNKTLNLAIQATEFKLHGQMYTLVSLQNIQNEIERERMAKELEIARNVQNSLLPKQNPKMSGYDIAGACIPAKEVGGDYYDFIQNENNKLGIVIGDVSGKGVPASIYMTLTKGIIQSQANGQTSPREMLIKVNSFMYKSIEPGAFVTIFYAVLDGNTGKIDMTRAGHNPAIHYSAMEDKFSLIEPLGIGIALEEGEVFQDKIKSESVYLHSGDWLVLYTDGFTEAMNKKQEEYGEERFINSIRMNQYETANGLITAIRNDVQNFVGKTEQFDDMTMIAIKVIKRNDL